MVSILLLAEPGTLPNDVVELDSDQTGLPGTWKQRFLARRMLTQRRVIDHGRRTTSGCRPGV